MSFQPPGSPRRRRQQTSRGDTSDIFVIIRDNKKRNTATKQAHGARRSGLLREKTMSRKIPPTFDNPDHVLSIRRRISRGKKKTTNLHYCFEDL